jgi:hypothetical protein
VDPQVYVLAFVGLLAAYLAYAAYARLDPRWPILGAFVLLVAGAALDASGNPNGAELLGVDAFLALLGGLVAMALTAPGGPGRLAAPGAEPVDEREPEADPPLDDLEEHPVAVVDRPAGPDHQRVDPGDGQPQHG